jgi:hypothetical protein
MLSVDPFSAVLQEKGSEGTFSGIGENQRR